MNISPRFLAAAANGIWGFLGIALISLFIGAVFIWGGVQLLKSPSFKDNSAGCLQVGLVVLLFILGGGALLLGVAIGGCGFILSSANSH
jgi:hypothetical protein